MMKHAWTTVFAVGVTAGIPLVASAHGPYLEATQAAADAVGDTPCTLDGLVCGLCHEPSEGDRNENIVVDFPQINADVRNGPFYDSLDGAAGWNHEPHGGESHIGDNLALLEPALAAMVDMDIDSDSDGVGDIEELSLGYNPLLAYDEGDPGASQICGDAEDFPEVGGSSGSTTDGGDSTTGGDPPGTTSGDPPGTTDDGGNDDTTGDDPPPTNPPGDGSTSGAGGSGSTGSGTAGGGGDEEGGCRIGGSGYGRSALGMLLLLGLAARRRRYA